MTDQDKIKDLLTVLDLAEYEQFEWLDDNGILPWKDLVYAPDFEGYRLDKKATLADLAFRLTKEINNWPLLAQCLVVVRMYWCKHTWEQRKSAGETQKHIPSGRFWNHVAGPILKVIAALIAKEKK